LNIFTIIKSIGWIVISGLLVIAVLTFVVIIVQSVKKYIKLRIYQNRKRRINKKGLKRQKIDRKTAPSNLKILMQPKNKILFESFVKLLDNIRWPSYPGDFSNEDEFAYNPSIEEIEEYEEELEEAIEEEDRMYALYLTELQSKEIVISKSELSHVIELYEVKFEKK